MDNKERALGFDDILLLPAAESEIKSRKEVDTTTRISRNISIKYPIISAPMDTISDVETCIALNKIGAAGILHRFMPIEEQIEKAIKIKQESGRCYVAVGLKDYEKRILSLLKNTIVDLFVLDTANINTPLVKDFMTWYNCHVFMPDIMIGNTLTTESVNRAFSLGANSVRHGIGNGGVCLTTDVTGVGCPPITSLQYAWDGKRDENDVIILDGGIKKSADLVKSLVFGTNAVMCGSIFAGCKETPGDVYKKVITPYGKELEIENKEKFEYFTTDIYGMINPYIKKFRGMASYETLKKYDLWDGTQENLFVEGKEIEVPYTNESVTSVVFRYVNGLRSAMSYLNLSNLNELIGSAYSQECQWIKI